MRVLVLDQHKQPLMPCQPARARQLLRDGKAAVYRRYPFTILLKDRAGGEVQPVSLKVDPGSKTTGIALVAHYQRGAVCILALHIEHRGHAIKESLDSRRAIRRSRRNRKTRYRKARFMNRAKPKGWLPPTLMSRVHNVETWTRRLVSWVPISRADVETVRFDTQLMENPDIQGVEYQRGSLMDWELREYLLARHQHQCAYCNGLSKDPILEREHIHPRSLGGSNRLANQVISCRSCNHHKGNHLPEVWMQKCSQKKDRLNQQRATSMQAILKGRRPSMRDAAAVNATRYATGRVIKQHIPDTEFWSGGRTKKNRSDQGYRKDHWIDAACVGSSGSQVTLETQRCLVVSAKGHGSRQQCSMNRYGFPRTTAKGPRSVQGFKTGDIVRAIVPKGRKQGTHTGRIAVRSSGSFNITCDGQRVQGISYRYCTRLHRQDGYGYYYEPKEKAA